MTVLYFQLSCNRGGLPMFELVDSQPSHLVSVDAINLTPGEYTAFLFMSDIFLQKSSELNCPPFFFFFAYRFLGLRQVGAVL